MRTSPIRILHGASPLRAKLALRFTRRITLIASDSTARNGRQFKSIRRIVRVAISGFPLFPRANRTRHEAKRAD